jgi:small nuclear ribonucleoprotein (snRNP)-like protein
MGEGGQQPRESKALSQLRSILNRTVRVTTPQGRTLTGELQCMDKQGNLVLGNVQEDLGAKTEPRRMGIVLVPLSQQKSVELQVCEQCRK